MRRRRTESESLRLEDACQRATLRRLLRVDLPRAAAQVEGELCDVVRLLCTSQTSGTMVSLATDPNLRGRHLRGHLTLTGSSIIQAEVEVQMQPWNGGRPFRTKISAFPWTLPQIQNAEHYAHLALRCVRRWKAQLAATLPGGGGGGGGGGSGNNNVGATTTYHGHRDDDHAGAPSTPGTDGDLLADDLLADALDDALEVVHEIMGHVGRARNEVMMPNPIAFPHVANACEHP